MKSTSNRLSVRQSNAWWSGNQVTRYFLLLALCLCTLAGNALAATTGQTLAVGAEQHSSKGVSNILVADQFSTDAGIGDVIKQPSAFRAINNRYNPGYTNNSVWMKLEFDRDAINAESGLYVRFLVSGGVREMYYFDRHTGWQKERAGATVPYAEWPVKSFRESFRVDHRLADRPEVYIRFAGSGPLSTSHDVVSAFELAKSDTQDILIWGTLVGLTLLAGTAALVFFAFTRDPAYLYFSTLCAGLTSWNILILGFLNFLAPSLNPYYYQLVYITIACIGVSAVQFMRYFVGFKQFLPRFDKGFSVLIPVFVIASVVKLVFINDAYATMVVAIVTFVAGVMALGGLLYGVWKRNRASILLAIGWTPGVAIAVVSVPTFMGLVPGYWWNSNIVTLASTVAVILFSIALGDKVNLLQKRHNQLLLDQAEALQAKVEEQTEHLTAQTKELSRQSRVLAQILSYKEELLSNIAHELKTPLTLMLGVLTSGLNENDKNTRLRRMIHRVSLLLDNMLTLARLEQVQTLEGDNRHAYRCHEFIEFYVSTYSGFVPENRLKLSQNMPATVVCAPDTLDRVITNLINNAIKYSPQDTCVEVRAGVEGANWYLAVENQGTSIKPDQVNAAFERYVQLDEEHNSYGLGLGLAIVKSMITSANGEISITSPREQTILVTIKLPLAPAGLDSKGIASDDLSPQYRDWLHAEIEQSAVAQVVEPLNIENKPQSDTLVYCIDDNRELLVQLTDQLGGRFRIETFTQPREALLTAKEKLPDLIVSDVMMPQMSGFDLIKNIRDDELLSHIPVVLLTARNDRQSHAEGLQLLADDYITKPYDPQLLASKIDSLISIRKLLKARVEVVSDSEHDNELEILVKNCPPGQAEFLSKVLNVMHKQLTNPDFNIVALSNDMHYSESQLRRKVKAITGYTPQELMRIVRLQSAAGMIQRGDSLKAVAVDCGFSSQSHMGRVFKAFFGQTPNQYRSDHTETEH